MPRPTIEAGHIGFRSAADYHDGHSGRVAGVVLVLDRNRLTGPGNRERPGQGILVRGHERCQNLLHPDRERHTRSPGSRGLDLEQLDHEAGH